MLSDECARLFCDSRLLYDEVGLLRGVAPGSSGLGGGWLHAQTPQGNGPRASLPQAIFWWLYASSCRCYVVKRPRERVVSIHSFFVASSCYSFSRFRL
jgi:hypothetical protein